jgi:hypothetical protein
MLMGLSPELPHGRGIIAATPASAGSDVSSLDDVNSSAAAGDCLDDRATDLRDGVSIRYLLAKCVAEGAS